MKQQVWTETYQISSFLVNLRGRAGLYSILNLIQDVGWMHAIHLEVKLEKHLGWVFTRQKLVMKKWPAWNEKVSIKTWLRPPVQDAFLLRDYEIYAGDEKIGECTSTFTVMDMQTRKIAPMDWNSFASMWRTEGHLAHVPGKIPVNDQVQDLAQFQVRNSDIDLNNHVNNTRYAQWILDALPIEILRAGAELNEYEVNFLAENKIGDVVNVQGATTALQDGLSTLTHFQGLRGADRKPVFTATLRVF